MAMPKTLSANQLLGGQGINLIERLVNRMGFVWRATATHDVGIDGCEPASRVDQYPASNLDHAWTQ